MIRQLSSSSVVIRQLLRPYIKPIRFNYRCLKWYTYKGKRCIDVYATNNFQSNMLECLIHWPSSFSTEKTPLAALTTLNQHVQTFHIRIIQTGNTKNLLDLIIDAKNEENPYFAFVDQEAITPTFSPNALHDIGIKNIYGSTAHQIGELNERFPDWCSLPIEALSNECELLEPGYRLMMSSNMEDERYQATQAKRHNCISFMDVADWYAHLFYVYTFKGKGNGTMEDYMLSPLQSKEERHETWKAINGAFDSPHLCNEVLRTMLNNRHSRHDILIIIDQLNRNMNRMKIIKY